MTFPIVADATGEIFSLLGLVRSNAIDPTQGIVPQAGCVGAPYYFFFDFPIPSPAITVRAAHGVGSNFVGGVG